MCMSGLRPATTSSELQKLGLQSALQQSKAWGWRLAVGVNTSAALACCLSMLNSSVCLVPCSVLLLHAILTMASLTCAAGCCLLRCTGWSLLHTTRRCIPPTMPL